MTNNNLPPEGAVFYQQQEYEGLTVRIFLSGHMDNKPMFHLQLADSGIQINLKAIDALNFGNSIATMAGNAVKTQLENATQTNT